MTPSLVSAIAAVDRLGQIVEKLLALARDSRCDVEPIDVHEVLDELERDWHRRTTTSQRPLPITIDPHAPRCVASGTAVRQVLAVLLDNAAAHGGGAVSLTARDARSLAEADGGRLTLTSAHPATFTLLLPGADRAPDEERALS